MKSPQRPLWAQCASGAHHTTRTERNSAEELSPGFLEDWGAGMEIERNPLASARRDESGRLITPDDGSTGWSLADNELYSLSRRQIVSC